MYIAISNAGANGNDFTSSSKTVERILKITSNAKYNIVNSIVLDTIAFAGNVPLIMNNWKATNMANKINDVSNLFLLLLNKPFINCGIITTT